jgi:hypothetical protein
VDKRKRGEGDNMLGDRLQDNISARAETRGFSEQQQAVRTPGACQTPHASSGHLSCRSTSALAGRVRALSWAGYVQNM